MNLNEFEEKIGYKFKNITLLETALTHSSYANEKQLSRDCNERLEFLGDSVLGMNTALYLFKKYPDAEKSQIVESLKDTKSFQEKTQELKFQRMEREKKGHLCYLYLWLQICFLLL